MIYLPKASVLFTYAAIVLAVACFSSGDKEQNAAKETAASLADGFAPFFEKFKTDSVFQAAHIVFPLASRTDFWNDMKMITMETVEEVSARDWTFFDFSMEGNDDLTWEMNKVIDGDKATIELRAGQNRLGVDLHFIREDGIWKLKLMHNRTTIDQYGGLYAIGVSDEFKFFFETFRNDEDFQFHHTRFDLPLEHPSDEDIEKKEIVYINQDSWRKQRFDNSFSKDAEHLEYVVHQDGDKAKVDVRCLDCGVSMQYFFEPHAGSWQLVKIEDYSM